jgi:hypothetical protein
MATSETNAESYKCHVCNKRLLWKNNGISTRNPETGECNSCFERNEGIVKYKRLAYEKTTGGCNLKLSAMQRFVILVGENPGLSPKEIFENELLSKD